MIGAFKRSGRIATVALRLLYLIFQQVTPSCTGSSAEEWHPVSPNDNLCPFTFTPKRSLVRSQYRPPAQTPPSDLGRGRLTIGSDNNAGAWSRVVSDLLLPRLATSLVLSGAPANTASAFRYSRLYYRDEPDGGIIST